MAKYKIKSHTLQHNYAQEKHNINYIAIEKYYTTLTTERLMPCLYNMQGYIFFQK